MRSALEPSPRGSLFLVAMLALALWAPSANAQRNCPGGSDDPPGNSEIDQYSENVPGPCGDQPVNPPSDGSDTTPSGSVPAGTVDDLNSLGADGQAAAALAQATAPNNQGSAPTAVAAKVRERLPGTGALADRDDASNGSIFDDLSRNDHRLRRRGRTGSGLLLPLILIAALDRSASPTAGRRTTRGIDEVA